MQTSGKSGSESKTEYAWPRYFRRLRPAGETTDFIVFEGPAAVKAIATEDQEGEPVIEGFYITGMEQIVENGHFTELQSCEERRHAD